MITNLPSISLKESERNQWEKVEVLQWSVREGESFLWSSSNANGREYPLEEKGGEGNIPFSNGQKISRGSAALTC